MIIEKMTLEHNDYYFSPEKINLIKSQLHAKRKGIITAERTASDW